MKKKYPYIILLILGVLVETIAFSTKPAEITSGAFLYEMFLNVGFVILAIVIVDFLWVLLGGEPLEEMIHKAVHTLELAADGFKGGLDRAFLSSSSVTTSGEWISLLKRANSQIDMMGYSLNMLTRTTSFQELLKELANKNVKIRILIMDCENPHFAAGLNIECLTSMTIDSMKDEVNACTQCVESAFDKIRNNKKKNLQFAKIKKGLAECQIIRIDNYIYVTPYLYSKHTADSPLFIFKEQKDGYYDKYLDEFNMLWEQNKCE